MRFESDVFDLDGSFSSDLSAKLTWRTSPVRLSTAPVSVIL